MSNLSTRKKISDAGLRHWQVAEEIGISACTLSVWLRKPLEGEKLDKVENALSRLIERETRKQ